MRKRGNTMDRDTLSKRLEDLVEKRVKLQERGSIKGHLKLVLTGLNGEIKDVREHNNTITVLYDALVADRMAAGVPSLVDYTAVGTTSGGKSTASTTLEAQVNPRVQNDSNVQGAGANDNDVIHTATFAPGVGTGALVEAGLFPDLTNPTMMAFQDFGVINKGAGDTLTTTWTITHGAS